MSRMIAMFLVAAAAAFAHIKPGSLNLKSGMTYTAGQKLTLSWSASIDHNMSNYNLWYSSDAGKNWTTVKMGIPGKASNVLVTYDWTVPSEPTTTGMIRVFQIFGGTVATNPASPGDYTLFSPTFTIKASSAVTSRTESPASLRLVGDHLEVGFDAHEPGPISLDILGMDGSRHPSIELSGATSGADRFAIPVAELGHCGPSVVRLRRGGEVLAQRVILLPR